MRRIRVLIIDDSVVIRKILGDALAADPDIEVAGLAANGRIGLAKIAQVNPDAVTLDVEMPEMDGLATIREIRKVWPRLPVVMFSTLCERGAAATIEALSRGASDYVTKPSNVGSVNEAIRRITTDLSTKLKALCSTKVASPATASRPSALPSPSTRTPIPPLSFMHPAAGRGMPTLLAIGSSTGGPVALADVIGGLQAGLPVPTVITQHMPPMFTRLLAERLRTTSSLRVSEAVHGQPAEPGCVYVAPGDHHMRVVRTDAGGLKLMLDQGPPENSCRPAVDVMFRSAAEACGAGVLGVVLTGMGQDGMLGARRIVEAGGTVLAQDEATSVVWGMPGAVVREGLAEKALPLGDIALEICRRFTPSAASGVAPGVALRKGA